MTDAGQPARPKLVLNAGSGPPGPNALHPCFAGPRWREIRLDIDPAARPDIVGDVIDMRDHFGPGTFDAVWSSHNIEHLHAHEVPSMLAEFRRVLKPDGFALLTCPDLEAVVALAAERGLHFKAYDAPIGPITVHDMMFGHGASIAAGRSFMAHRTGFTQASLGAAAQGAGFRETVVGRGTAFDLWAVLCMPDCDPGALRDAVRGTDLDFLLAGPDGVGWWR